MQYVQKNNDIISVQTGEIRARIVMLNTEEVRFGIMYGVINEMDRDEILDYVASYSGVNGVFETFESAMAHAMASMQPVPTPFVADNPPNGGSNTNLTHPQNTGHYLYNNNFIKMNKYTIKYQYGTYSGTEIVYADDEETAVSKMWRTLKKYMTLGMAYQSHTIVDVEYNYDGD